MCGSASGRGECEVGRRRPSCVRRPSGRRPRHRHPRSHGRPVGHLPARTALVQSSGHPAGVERRARDGSRGQPGHPAQGPLLRRRQRRARRRIRRGQADRPDLDDAAHRQHPHRRARGRRLARPCAAVARRLRTRLPGRRDVRRRSGPDRRGSRAGRPAGRPADRHRRRLRTGGPGRRDRGDRHRRRRRPTRLRRLRGRGCPAGAQRHARVASGGVGCCRQTS